MLPRIGAANGECLDLKMNGDSYNPSSHLQVYEDPLAELSIEDIRAPDIEWTANDMDIPSFGYSASNYWLRLKLCDSKQDNSNLLLAITYPILDKIDVYIFSDEAVLAHHSTGDTQRFHSRLVDNRNFLFPIDHRRNQAMDIYIKVNSESSVQVPISIWKRERYFINDQLTLVGQGFYFGIMFVMIVYNLFILTAVRQVTYVFYVGAVLSTALFMSSINGFGFQYLWPEIPTINRWALPVTLALMGVFALSFTITMLKLGDYSQKLLIFIKGLIGLCFVMFLLALFLPYRSVIVVLVPLCATACLVGLITGVYVLAAGYRPARFYVLAWSFFLVGSILISMSKLGLIPRNFFTENSMQIGSLLEVILLSFALADRISMERKEKIEVEKKMANMRLKLFEESFAEKEKVIAANAALEAKDEFLSTMSHEIRTPMNGVLGVLDLLHQTSLDDQQQEFVSIMDGSAKTLLSIINDILDFSKIQSGKMTIEKTPFHLHRLIHEVFDLYKMTSQIKTEGDLHLKLDLDPSIPSAIVGDPVRIKQILTNYFNNAMKFTSDGSITLKAKLSKDRLRFEVVDTGIGISEESLNKLFVKFNQAEASTTRKYGGTGLGLSICKLLAELMGGQVGANSTLGKGSTFWFEMPFETYEGELAEQTNESHESLATNMSVLLVDDNSVNRFVATKMLNKMGIEPDVAEDGQAAVELHKRNIYDVIFMDCQMPVMDGFEATGLIRRLENECSKSFIVALTASASEKDRDHCLAAGMDAHLTKPISIDSLSNMLHRYQVDFGFSNSPS